MFLLRINLNKNIFCKPKWWCHTQNTCWQSAKKFNASSEARQVRAQRRKLTFRKAKRTRISEPKSYAVGDTCNGKGIQSSYFRYNSNISKCKRGHYVLQWRTLMLLVSNFHES